MELITPTLQGACEDFIESQVMSVKHGEVTVMVGEPMA